MAFYPVLGDGGVRFLRNVPQSNVENGVPVVFCVQVVAKHPHIVSERTRDGYGWI